jgi:hypothetical protein
VPVGPTLAVVTNPNDPMSKLLVVMGCDAAELRTAASALAVGGPALSGRMATVTGLKELEARKPYDAPAWLRSDRPVRFGEIADQRALNVSGYTPDTVRINFRAPPDLFAWRDKGIPVDLRYRYTPRPTPDKSTLNINVNDQYLRAYPLRAASHAAPSVIDALLPTPDDGMVMARERVRVPLSTLPAQSQLQFHYYYDYVKQGFCKDVMLDNVRGAIDADSTIDISGFSHFLAMPDLAAFGNSGFPFTRMADLSQTAVVMPDKGDLPEWSAYLNLMGLMGRSSGYPVTGVQVTPASLVEKVSDKDLLVISSGADQPLLQRWERDLPAVRPGLPGTRLVGRAPAAAGGAARRTELHRQRPASGHQRLRVALVGRAQCGDAVGGPARSAGRCGQCIARPGSGQERARQCGGRARAAGVEPGVRADLSCRPPRPADLDSVVPFAASPGAGGCGPGRRGVAGRGDVPGAACPCASAPACLKTTWTRACSGRKPCTHASSPLS